MHLLDRRSFLTRSAALAGGSVLTAAWLDRLGARAAGQLPDAGAAPYGPLERKRDQHGREILALPAAFSYVTFGEIGSTMSDGRTTPVNLDGMAAFRGPNGRVRLIRNHEDRGGPGKGSLQGPPRTAYDAAAGGGTSSLDFDVRRQRLVRDFVSLHGTIVNCAGGISWRRRGWLTGEETVAGPDNTQVEGPWPKRHGYVFETPVRRGPRELRPVFPYKEMGRFSHEAVAVDQVTGMVYETEDPGGGRGAGFYRFTPYHPARLHFGGELHMLAVSGAPDFDAREGQTPGQELPVSWVLIDDPDPPYANLDDERGTFRQGRAKGGALFNRLEGCWYEAGKVYFVSTSGGDAKSGDVNRPPATSPDREYKEGFGQVWEYDARRSVLRLVYESPGAEALDSPDNLTVTPRGGLMLCEDDASAAHVDTHPLAPGLANVNRVIGLTLEGQAFEFAVNCLNAAELAGVCFSPDGLTMFFNIFVNGTPGSGMTCAVTGPWEDGPL